MTTDFKNFMGAPKIANSCAVGRKSGTVKAFQGRLSLRRILKSDRIFAV